LDIDFIGRHQADKVASCPYCEQIIDLPDADDANSKVRTSERIIERPNERIVERVSEWSRSSSTPLDWPEDLPGGLDELTSDLRSRLLPKRPGEASSAPPVIWQIDGQTFSSADEVRAYVEENMPAGMADRVLTLIDADRPRE
ncbi:MAG: hypothetical protein QF805_29950, partial [Pirellulaceae bacterium]|nr:hypothetical protein [Pirellulaceae bacterium]